MGEAFSLNCSTAMLQLIPEQISPSPSRPSLQLLQRILPVTNPWIVHESQCPPTVIGISTGNARLVTTKLIRHLAIEKSKGCKALDAGKIMPFRR